MKLPVFAGLCLITGSLAAQRSVDVTEGNVNALSTSFFNIVGGEPFVVKFTKLVEGSPYFSNEWLKGNVTLDGGKEFDGIPLRLDLYDNQVHYRNANGVELIASPQIKKLSLFDTAAKQTFNFINGSSIAAKKSSEGWYQVLTNGKASLFKKYEKRLIEDRPYGSATVEQSIMTFSHYYILTNGEDLKEIKKFKDLPDLLNGKKEEVSTYIKDKRLSGKKDDDYRDVVNYFNGLN